MFLPIPTHYLTAYADEKNIWGGSASYGDIWHNFAGRQWKASEAMVNILKNSDDPRLTKITKPSVGGTINILKPTTGENVPLIADHVNFLKSTLDKAGLVQDTDYTWVETATDLTITMPENTNYVGLPSRLSGKIKSYMHRDMFSEPSEIVTQKTNEGSPIFPTILLTAADSHFMIAEAIVKGLVSVSCASENATKPWLGGYMGDFSASNMGTLNGHDEEKLEKIATNKAEI